MLVDRINLSENGKYFKIMATLFLLHLGFICFYLVYTEEYKLPNKLLHKQTKRCTRNHTSKIDLNWLETNPVYQQFQIKPLPVQKKVTILVIVSSGPRRIDRRNAIRRTWWQQCKATEEVTPECIFMTDHSPEGSKDYKITNEEFKKYGDLRFQHVPIGVTFGLRMLNHMVFAVSHYDFDYFLRVDDDYFMCFRNFLDEIPLPPLNRFHWGWVHRKHPITRPEESMLLLSRDLIETFVLQNPNKIMCHPLSNDW